MKNLFYLSLLTSIFVSPLALEATLPLAVTASSSIDGDVALKIKAALQNDHALSGYARSVQVSVHDGVVTLTGMVRSDREKRRVNRVVHRVDGVKSINNKLTTSFSE